MFRSKFKSLTIYRRMPKVTSSAQQEGAFIMSSQIQYSSTPIIRSEERGVIVAGTEEAAESFREITGELGIGYRFVSLNGSGDLIDLGDAQLADQVEVLWCHGRFTGAWVERAIGKLPNVKWVHSDFVGVDSVPIAEFQSRGIVLTNGGDNFARPMAEWTVLGILSSAKEYPRFIRNSDDALWDDSFQLKELRGEKVLLLGLGSVNSLVAGMLEPFDMEVVAWSRTRRSELPAGVTRNLIGKEWMDEIRTADYIVVGLPATKSTKGLIDREILETMKHDVTIINLARGAIIDQKALTEILDLGRLRYVLLDAYEIEPLPSNDPLWGRNNVTVLPHHSWSSQLVSANTVNRMSKLLRLYVSGLPFDRVVDYEAGY